MKWIFPIICLFAFSGVGSVEIIESELSLLPKLFHLDDYHKCLAEKNGLYCVGEFELSAQDENNPTFRLIKKYNHVPHLYNRTFVHRGYCLPERCAGAGRNASARFERCVDTWARSRHGLQARLTVLHYCQKHGEKASNAPDTNDLPHRAFLYVVYFLLFMNAVGTIYDLKVEEKDIKYPNLLLWSIRRNWKRLTMSSEGLDPKLRFFEPLNGLKVLLTLGTVTAHVGILASKMYQKDPRFIENEALHSFPAIGSLTNFTQLFVTIANFLLANGLLQYSKNKKLGFHMLPVLILKRLVRLLPVYLLMTGFAATWWSSLGEGPLWPLIVNEESGVCRRKYWAIAGFLQNFFEPEHVCLVQTWIFSVDIQIYVLSLIICLFAIKHRRYAGQIFVSAFVAAIAVTFCVSFRNQYHPMFYKGTTPENMRTLYANDRTFVGFYIKPTNCLITAATGLLMGYISYKTEGRKPQKWIIPFSMLAIPCIFGLSFYTVQLRRKIDPMTATAFVTVERLIASFLFMLVLQGMEDSNVVMKVFKWQPLHPFARLSLCVSMVHWCVNAYLLGTRTMLQDYSTIGLIVEVIGTWMLSHMLAVPLILLVEYPVQKFIEKSLIAKL